MSPGVHVIRRGGARRWLVSAAVLACVLMFSPLAHAEGPNAVQDLPGCDANTLPANDDSSTEAIPLGRTVSFFGREVSELYVNNNGNVTFDQPLSQYTPFDFTATGEGIIAPFLADVDTTGAASGVVTYGPTTVDSRDALCVNWIDVGYFSARTDKLNSFQLLLIDRSDTGAGNFDIVFNYDKVQWETGDASGGQDGLGGVSAAVGFANGDGDPDHQFTQPGSYENGALLDSGPPATSLTANSRGTTQLGRYVFEVRNAPPTGATLTGVVKTPDGDLEESRAPVEICAGAGGCVARIADRHGVYRAANLAAGTYTVTARSAQGTHADGIVENVAVSGTGTIVQDVTLGPALGSPPPGTEITSIATTEEGLPVVRWSDPLQLSTDGCAGAVAGYQVVVDGTVVRSGTLSEGPAGTYTATIPALQPNTGAGIVSVALDCPSDPDEAVEFGIYIDPSGFVRTTAGVPIPDATVILFRSGTPDGTFVQVPNGSTIMSPSNRENPDTTDATGHFGWDVIAGYYTVRASAPGCSTAETEVMTIPPPVTDLDIRLACEEDPGPGPGPDPGPGPGPGPGDGGGGGSTPIDAKAPETSIGKGPGKKVDRGKAKFTFTSSEGSSKFECRLKGKEASKAQRKYALCSSPKKYRRLEEGRYKFQVLAIDAAGNVDPNPATVRFEVG